MTALLFLTANLASFASVIGAIILAREGVEGWGWFLFCGVILASDVNSKS